MILALPFGKFGVRTAGRAIDEMLFLPPDTAVRPAQTAFDTEIAARIERWLADPRTPLTLPLARRGTPFQQRVWQALCAIPAGEMRTYGELARALQTAPRALGQACGANPFPLAIPCHRVVSATGLGGFAHARDGYLLGAKRWLLSNEAG